MSDPPRRALVTGAARPGGIARTPALATSPGRMALAVTPWAPFSAAIVLTIPSSPALLAL